MTNPNTPFGFNLIDSTSSSQSISLQYAKLDSGNSHVIKKGDPISALSGGTVVQSVAADAGIVAGIAVQFYDTNFQAITQISASQTTGWVLFQPVDQSKIFEVQANGVVAETDIWATADFAVGAGNSYTDLSVATLDVGTIGTGQQMRIIGKVGGPQDSQNIWGAYTKLLVVFTESIFQNNTSI